MRNAAIAVGVAYLASLALGIFLLADGQTGAAETVLVAGMAGGWFGSRWVVRRARERDGGE